MTNEEFRAFGHQLVDWAADYRARLGDRPVGGAFVPGAVKAALPDVAPDAGGGLGGALETLDSAIVPNLVHWQHPAYFGWFPTGGLEAGVLGDFVSTVLGVVGLSWQSAPAMAELEDVTMAWMRADFGLPEIYRGVIQESASTATMVALLCARERASDFALQRDGQTGALTVYYTAHSHSSVEKAALLAGFGRENLRMVACDADDAMDPAALAQMIAQDRAAGKVPAAIVASSGTTSVLAFDPLNAIADVAAREGVWFHVDAAMAGAALLLPEMRDRFAGIDRADSMVINAHKWLGVPFDCSLYYVRDPALLERVLSTNPAYLQSRQDGAVVNYRDWGLPLGRRFRALKLWFVLVDQGISGLQARLRRDLDNARWLGEQVAETPDWRLVRPVRLQTVCVRHEPAGLSGEALDAHTKHWADRVNDSGLAWVSPSKMGDEWLVRVSIGAHTTERHHIAAAWAAMRRLAEATG